PVRLRLEGQPPAPLGAHAHVGPAAQVRPRLQGDLRRRRHHEPLRDPAARRLGGVLQRGAGRGMGQALRRRLPEVRLAQSRAGGNLAVPAVDRHPEAAHERAHVPHHAERPRARHEAARAMNAPLKEQFLTLQEIYEAAKRNLPPGPWSYLIGGAETETTVRRNRHALDSIAFRPRVLRDVSRVDVSGKFLGKATRLPVMLAPIGGLESIVEGGAATAARGAAAFGVPQMLSSVCQPGLEQTAAAADTVRVFQLYVR